MSALLCCTELFIGVLLLLIGYAWTRFYVSQYKLRLLAITRVEVFVRCNVRRLHGQFVDNHLSRCFRLRTAKSCLG